VTANITDLQNQATVQEIQVIEEKEEKEEFDWKEAFTKMFKNQTRQENMKLSLNPPTPYFDKISE